MPAPIPIEPDRDLAVLLCSSTPSGLSAVAELTHRGAVAAVHQVEPLAPVTTSEWLICLGTRLFTRLSPG